MKEFFLLRAEPNRQQLVENMQEMVNMLDRLWDIELNEVGICFFFTGCNLEGVMGEGVNII